MEDLQKLLKTFNKFTDKIVSEQDITDILIGISAVLKKYKEESENLNKDTLALVNEAEGHFYALYTQLKEQGESNSVDFNTLKSEILAIANNLKNGVDGKDGADGVDGKDADEEFIVEKVLSQIKLPEFKQNIVTGEEIVDKINELSRDPENQIDFSHIKNVPPVIQGGHSPTVLNNAVDLDQTDKTDGYAVVWDATRGRFKFAASGGSGSGDVVGPASATDNALARFDSTTGKLIQNSSAVLDDSGNLSTNGLLLSGQTASRLAIFDGSKNVISADTATYPSLAELSYVKGVTSAIQTQIADKFTLPTLTSGSILFSNGTTIAQDNSNLFWDDTNNRLGIGNTSPSYKLDITSSSSGTTINTLRLANNGAGANTQVKVSFNAASTEYANITAGYGATAPQMAFDLPNVTLGRYIWSINSVEKMRIDTTGNVGIGTTAPSSLLDLEKVSAALEIRDRTTVYTPSDQPSRLILSTRQDVDADLAPYVGSAIEFQMDWNGSSIANAARIVGRGHKAYGGALDFDIADGSTGASSPYVTRMRIAKNGNVGIGTIAPLSNFHIVSSYSNAFETFENNASTYIDLGAVGATSVVFDSNTDFRWRNKSYANRGTATFSSNLMALTSAGSLGVGTASPYGKLDVTSGNVYLTQDYQLNWHSSGTIRSNIVGDSSDNLKFSTRVGGTLTEAMRINGSGNVGIGVTPSSSWDAARKILQISTTGALVSSANNTLYSDNWYFDGTNNRYLTTQAITIYQQASGVHKWFTAPSGTAGTIATTTSRMELSNTGALTVASVTAITSNTDLSLGGNGTGAVKHTTSTYQDIVSATDGTTVTFDLSDGNYQKVTLGGNRTLALSNVKVGQFFVIDLVQDGTGSRTVTWFTTIKWAGGSAPTLTTTASKIDSLGFVCTSSGNYQGYILGQNL